MSRSQSHSTLSSSFEQELSIYIPSKMCMAQSFTQAYDNRQDQPDNYLFIYLYIFYKIIIILNKYSSFSFFFFQFDKLNFFPFLFIIPNNILQLTFSTKLFQTEIIFIKVLLFHFAHIFQISSIN